MGQITLLHEHSTKRQNDHYKFLAAIQGIDLDKENGKETNKTNSNSNIMEFQDPDAYKDMSDEEKDKLTNRMKGMHMRSIQSSGFGK